MTREITDAQKDITIFIDVSYEVRETLLPLEN